MPDSRYRVSVQVQSQYLPEQSVPGDRMFAFAYTVTIRNDGSVPAQLVSRHWHIEDETGKVVEVDGLGVVGQQPLLAPGESFEYTSGSQIGTPKGSMQGSYFFVAEDGHRFDVPIPLFVLAMPRTLH
jgi:ApaG protein